MPLGMRSVSVWPSMSVGCWGPKMWKPSALHPPAARRKRHGAAQVAYQTVVRVHRAAEVESPVGFVDHGAVQGHLDSGVGQAAHVRPLGEGPAQRWDLADVEQGIGREAVVPGDFERDTIAEQRRVEAQLRFTRAFRTDEGVAHLTREETGLAGRGARPPAADGVERARSAARPSEGAAQLHFTPAGPPEGLVRDDV